ncbi:MAG: hypothetical protein Q9188_000069 [Gyalolechia gomerana]
MRIIAFSLVTNNAVLEPGMRGDDPSVKNADRQALTRALATGKANHGEVLKAGEEAAKDLEGLIQALAMTIVNEDGDVAGEA